MTSFGQRFRRAPRRCCSRVRGRPSIGLAAFSDRNMPYAATAIGFGTLVCTLFSEAPLSYCPYVYVRVYVYTLVRLAMNHLSLMTLDDSYNICQDYL
jgi:hypothetical protein